MDEDRGRDSPGDELRPATPEDLTPFDELHARLQRLEHAVDPERPLREADERVLLPAWRRVTQGEPRWPVSLAVLAAIAMQIALPERLAIRPHWLMPALEALLLVGLVVANPRRLDRESAALRRASIALIALTSLANTWSAARLVLGLVRGTEGQDAAPLLLTGPGRPAPVGRSRGPPGWSRPQCARAPPRR